MDDLGDRTTPAGPDVRIEATNFGPVLGTIVVSKWRAWRRVTRFAEKHAEELAPELHAAIKSVEERLAVGEGPKSWWYAYGKEHATRLRRYGKWIS